MSVSDVEKLELFVDCPGRTYYAQAVWADPILQVGGQSYVILWRVRRCCKTAVKYETEVWGERVRAGQVVALANGKHWGGSKPGVRKQVSDTKVRAILKMKADGERIADIAQALGVSRPTVYAVLNQPDSQAVANEGPFSL